MPVSVTMPRLGESVTEGTVTRWLKQEGDRVEADEPLLEVSTDKVDTEIPSPASGVLTRIVVREDETAEVGSELAVIGDEGADDAGGQQDATRSESQSESQSGAATNADAPAEATEAPPTQTDNVQEARVDSDSAAGAGSSGSGGGADSGTPVKMPALGESVTEGTVTRWLKQVGDRVEVDEPLLEVSTDKVDTEIPSPVAGVLTRIVVQEDETAPVGAELAIVGGDSDSGGNGDGAAPEQAAPEQAAPAQAQAEQAQPEQAAPEQAAPERDEPAQPQPVARAEPASSAPVPAEPAVSVTAGDSDRGNGKVDGDESGYVTPLVRKLATENNVDLSKLTGTGVGGRIRKQDVLEAAEKQRTQAQRKASAPAAAVQEPAQEPAKQPAKAPAEPSPLRGRTEKLSRMRALIARRMVESLQVSAQLTTVVEVDVTRIARLRDLAKRDFQQIHGVKLSFLPFFAQAAVEALRIHPVVNASIDVEAGTVTYHDAEHLGIAVDTERGLMVPVIRNAGDLNLPGLAKKIADLAERTRSMKIEPDEVSGGTFTLTNTGSRGALFDTPIINQPQVAILGTGSVVKRAVVVDDPDLGEIIAPRSMVYLAMSYDHRLVDGADAARFLTTVKERLDAGAFESELGLG